MTINPQQAAQALQAIESTASKVRQSQFYQHTAIYLTLWGTIIAVCYAITQFAPHQANWTWAVGSLAGAICSLTIRLRAPRAAGQRADLRWLGAYAIFLNFGVATIALGHFGQREIAAFWTLYFMMAYMLAGLWLGRALVAIGMGVTALTFIGYAFAGEWFALWMAMANGVGLIGGGLWMRRS